MFLYYDNLNAMYMGANLVFHGPTHHIKLDYHCVREKVALGSHHALFSPSIDQPAAMNEYKEIFIHNSKASLSIGGGTPS